MNGVVDSRVAAHGGTRTNPKKHYEFPGMERLNSWVRTAVHKATSHYGCALCGYRAGSPNAVYTHLAKIHDR